MSAPLARDVGSREPGFRIVVVDDDREMRQSLADLLAAAGWQAEVLARGDEVLRLLDTTAPDVVLSDVRMPGMSGLDLLNELTGRGAPPVVLISAHGDIPMAVEAMQAGAYSFLEKPFDPHRLLTVLKHAAEQHRLRQDADRLRARLARLAGLDRVLLGETPALRAVREDILDLSDTRATVLIVGETGTGKELVARALHDLSARAAGPFVALNCAAIPVRQFEESTFGGVDGNEGILTRADTGTLFLDEVAECPTGVQAKLLRALETGEFTPVGSDRPRRVDVRVISAANEPLDAAVEDGRFRDDLYFRLNNVVLTLPALRDRRDDVPLLYQHFLAQHAALYEIAAPETTAEDLSALLAHDWPGNVRELRHVAQRRALAARRGRGSAAEAIRVDDGGGDSDVPDTLREAVAALERHLIANAIRTHNGRMDAVAEALGIGRRTLNEKIVKLGLNKAELL